MDYSLLVSYKKSNVNNRYLRDINIYSLSKKKIHTLSTTKMTYVGLHRYQLLSTYIFQALSGHTAELSNGS